MSIRPTGPRRIYPGPTDSKQSLVIDSVMFTASIDVVEIWSLTLREEFRLRVFENRALRRIFGPRRDEVTGEWRKLRNEELNYMYSSPNIIRVIKSRIMRWTGHVERMGERRGVYGVLVGKPEGKRPLGRPRRKWEDKIRWIFRKRDVGCGLDRADSE